MIITTVVVHNNTIHCHHQYCLALLVLYNTEYSIATFLIKPSYRAAPPAFQMIRFVQTIKKGRKERCRFMCSVKKWVITWWFFVFRLKHQHS